MTTITAIYENGVFRPTGPVELPDKSQVTFELKVIEGSEENHPQEEIWEILGRRYNSGQHDTAERHNEHQP